MIMMTMGREDMRGAGNALFFSPLSSLSSLLLSHYLFLFSFFPIFLALRLIILLLLANLVANMNNIFLFF